MPSPQYFDLPEKVLQFGTGVLLRGLPDYFIDKANKQKQFNGRIVVIKSTEAGDVNEFEEQDSLYTICIRGLDKEKKIEENIVNASISRVLSAKNNWDEVLKCAGNPEMQIIISNTTEVGITLVKDNVHASPPDSFPGKLLSFLYQRYKCFEGDTGKGMIIIPTELIPDNGSKLQSILLELAHQNGLEISFLDWLENCNYCCNSLVDCIVPGRFSSAQQKEIESALGYSDKLMIMSEAYRLWAIQADNEKINEVLSFSKINDGVVIVPDITVFRELKLRLLNGSHTFTCGLAVLSGFATVKEAMSDAAFFSFIQSLMLDEIVSAISGKELSPETARDFALKVLDRYKNPFIDHYWINITKQYSSKMAVRCVPVILSCIEKFGSVPQNMTIGFAAFLLFMKSERTGEGKYFGVVNGKQYPIEDEHAVYFYEKWKSGTDNMIREVLSNVGLWGVNLYNLPHFAQYVAKELNILLNDGCSAALNNVPIEKSAAIHK